MALVDVSELLVDPDFVDTISVISRVPTVNNYGENSLVDSTVVSVGSVQPAGGRAILRAAEGLRVENLSSFWFKGTIVATASGQYTAVLVFRGVRYQVKQVFDWTNFGQGWCEGLCVAEPPTL